MLYYFFKTKCCFSLFFLFLFEKVETIARFYNDLCAKQRTNGNLRKPAREYFNKTTHKKKESYVYIITNPKKKKKKKKNKDSRAALLYLTSFLLGKTTRESPSFISSKSKK